MVDLVQAPAASIWWRRPRQSGEGWAELPMALRTLATSNQMSSCTYKVLLSDKNASIHSLVYTFSYVAIKI